MKQIINICKGDSLDRDTVVYNIYTTMETLVLLNKEYFSFRLPGSCLLLIWPRLLEDPAKISIPEFFSKLETSYRMF